MHHTLPFELFDTCCITPGPLHLLKRAQAGNFQGSDTLQTLLEGVRFVLCSSNEGLEVSMIEGMC